MKKRIFWNRKTVAMVAVSVLLVPAMLSYLYLEFLTALHGREFDNPATVDDIVGQTGAMVVPPEFTKVINYSNTEAEVLWVHFTRHDASTHTWFEFSPVFIKLRRGKSEDGKQKWIAYTWHEPR
jgi:hypothetical protein